MIPNPSRPAALSHYRWFRVVSNHKRLFTSLAAGLMIGLLLAWRDMGWHTRLLAAWVPASLLYIIWTIHDLSKANSKVLREQARIEDEGRRFILTLTFSMIIVSIIAVVREARALHEAKDVALMLSMALIFAAMAVSWTMVHVVFSLYYTRYFYAAHHEKRPPGIRFPEEDLNNDDDQPVYSDFLYTAFIIGTSAQTADVSFTTTTSRRIALAHSVAAFVMNTTVLALFINLAASFLGG